MPIEIHIVLLADDFEYSDNKSYQWSINGSIQEWKWHLGFTLPMLRLLSSKAQARKDFYKTVMLVFIVLSSHRLLSDAL